MEAEYGTGDDIADALIPNDDQPDSGIQRLALHFAASSGAAKFMLGVGVAMAGTTGLVASGHAPAPIQHAAERLIPALKHDTAPVSHSPVRHTNEPPAAQSTVSDPAPDQMNTATDETCSTPAVNDATAASSAADAGAAPTPSADLTAPATGGCAPDSTSTRPPVDETTSTGEDARDGTNEPTPEGDGPTGAGTTSTAPETPAGDSTTASPAQPSGDNSNASASN